MLLASDAFEHVDISSEVEVLSYTYAGENPTTVLGRVDLGRTNGIAGNGSYNVRFYINDQEILPCFSIRVPAGQTTFIAHSKEISLLTNDVVSITVAGLIADTDVDCTSYLVEANAIDTDEIESIIQTSLRNVTLRPTRTVLGACRQVVRSNYLTPQTRLVKTFKKPI